MIKPSWLSPSGVTERLFDIDEVPEAPLLREPRGRKGAARGVALDARFANDYPPEWHRCPKCEGSGKVRASSVGYVGDLPTWPPLSDTAPCPDCLGIGSVKAMVRLLAGHRCERCLHPYVPKGDAKMLGVEPTPYRWSPCDERCSHGGPLRLVDKNYPESSVEATPDEAARYMELGERVEAEWRILTVHHLSGDKADLRWGNLCALCQRCHLEVQAKVVLERIYPHEHSEWFKPHAAWWYAVSYLGEDLTREEVSERMDELLALERVV